VLVLEVLQGADRGRKFVLPANEPQLIGRSSEALPITDHTVSRRHAELTPDEGQWFLRDLESSNGTYLNGRRIDGRTLLKRGDQIRCGSMIMVFVGTPDETKAEAVQIVDHEAFDLTVEGRVSPNDESMILASPDPVRSASDHLRVIYDLTALTSTAFERDELLERVMDLIFEEFEPDRGFILIQAAGETRPEPVVVRYRTRPRDRDDGRIPVSRTIVAHVVEHGEGILSTNAMNDSRFRSGDSVRDYGIRSAICVPIRTADRVLGVIHIDSSMANFTFTESQMRLLDAIGRHAGLALLNAQLVQSRMHTERLAAMGQTVASLSHAIKNILQGLRGGADAVELALNRSDLELAKEGWPILARNLDRIFALTLNMLAYSKPPNLEIELLSIDRLLREVAELIQPQCDRKRVGLLLDLADDMPPIPADANALHQALMNLVTNAVEAVPARKGVITIRTRYDAASHEGEIAISDNGPGVPEELREEIFEAFRSSKGQRGTGLGLAVTRKIVTEHGGRIELESEPGGGATFRLRLSSDHAALEAADTRLPRPRRSDLDQQFE
jgi:signal transduction histidine kinase